MSNAHYSNISIIGLGLIGSSVARAVKHYGLAENIIAYDTNPLTLTLGKEQGFVSDVADSPTEAVKNADLVVIATPPSVSIELIADIADAVKKDALVTDVVSIKSEIAGQFRKHFSGKALAIPAHPIAGSEKSGAAAGQADLFAGKRVVLTPDTPDDRGIAEITEFWQALGGAVEYMPADMHDLVYAHVSHMPQMLAFAFAPYAEKLASEANLPDFYSQFSRLCLSDQHLWRDIFAHNKAQLDPALARFLVLLGCIREELTEAEEQNTDKKEESSGCEVNEITVWAHWLPRLIASCLVATVAQQSRDVGFNFSRFAGQGFADFTSPLATAPEVDLEAMSHHAPLVVEALDELLERLSENVMGAANV